MPSSRSAPNRRCAVPGTPIMPAPSRLTRATSSMLVMPFTACLDSGFAQISVPAFSGAKVLRIQIGMLRADGRGHRLRMDHLGAEIRQLHRLVVRQRVDDGGVGHAARIGAQHAVHVGPDVDLARRRAASPKIEAEKSLPLRPSVVCRPRGSRRDEAGDDERAA